MALVLIKRKEKPRNCLLTPGGIGGFLSIDPGLNGTGWAVWDREKADKLVKPIASGSVPGTNAASELTSRCAWICTALNLICHQFSVLEVAVEMPQFMEGSSKGMAAARDGDLVSLSILVGAICGNMWKVQNGQSKTFGWTTHLVSVSQWKGNLKKDICLERVERLLPKWRSSTDTTHEADAVGLGLYCKGFFDAPPG